jgi:hypothetical protein
VSEWVAVGGLALAALTLLLAHLDRRHARSEALRTAVYERQLDAIGDVAKEMTALEVAVLDFVNAALIGQLKADPGAEIRAQVDRVHTSMLRNHHVLPQGTLDAIVELTRASGELSRTRIPRVLGTDPKEEAEEHINRWAKVRMRALEQMRHDLGVDPLGERIRELTGAAAADRRRSQLESLHRAAAIYREREGKE